MYYKMLLGHGAILFADSVERGAQKGPVYGKRLTEEQTQALDDLQAKRRRRIGA